MKTLFHSARLCTAAQLLERRLIFQQEQPAREPQKPTLTQAVTEWLDRGLNKSDREQERGARERQARLRAEVEAKQGEKVTALKLKLALAINDSIKLTSTVNGESWNDQKANELQMQIVRDVLADLDPKLRKIPLTDLDLGLWERQLIPAILQRTGRLLKAPVISDTMVFAISQPEGSAKLREALRDSLEYAISEISGGGSIGDTAKLLKLTRNDVIGTNQETRVA